MSTKRPPSIGVMYVRLLARRKRKKLRDIQPIAEVVEAASKNSLELKNAHKLLYPVRGKTVTQEMRNNDLLEFNGYLPVVERGEARKKGRRCRGSRLLVVILYCA